MPRTVCLWKSSSLRASDTPDYFIRIMVPIGVSVTDVLEVSKLLYNVIDVLRHSELATAEYEELVRLLYSLRTTFTTVEAHLRSRTVSDAGETSQQSSFNAFGFHVNECHQALLRLSKSLSKYAQPRSNSVLPSRIQASKRTVQWRLYIQKEATKLSKSLLLHMGALQLLMQESARFVILYQYGFQLVILYLERSLADAHSSELSSLAKDGTSHQRSLDDLKSSLAALTTAVNDRPRDIGYPLCGGIPSDHVSIRDGLGQNFFLPIDLCNSFMVGQHFGPVPRSMTKFKQGLNKSPPSQIQGLSWRTTCGPGSFRSPGAAFQPKVRGGDLAHTCEAWLSIGDGIRCWLVGEVGRQLLRKMQEEERDRLQAKYRMVRLLRK